MLRLVVEGTVYTIQIECILCYNKNMSLSINQDTIREMSYTDFVGFVNQWNVLPGAYTTLSKWGIFSRIDQKSKILELACTSGFSLREISNMFGSSGLGVDISEKSVDSANFNKMTYSENLNIEYVVADGEDLTITEKYSHVIVGAALKFFPNPEKTVDKIAKEYLVDGGYLLASPFYVIKEIPQYLIDEAREVFGITITTTNYKDTMCLYKDFEVIYEDREAIIEETEEELAHYCDSTIKRICVVKNIKDKLIEDAMYSRLLKIKQMSNKLRHYQNYSTLVLRYRKNIYPNRYTELF